MSSTSWIGSRTAVVVASSCLTLLTSGCQRGINKPFADGLGSVKAVTTSSVEAVRAADVETHHPRRPYAVMEAEVPGAAVSHGPLYFEDPFESADENDEQYAWTFEDGYYFFYGPTRFLVNIAFFPLSALVDPPWQMTTSEGD